MPGPSDDTLRHTPFIPYDPSVGVYTKFLGLATPWEFSGWKSEVMSWKRTAYIHAGLNPSQTYRVWGPDALKMLSEHCVNSLENFKIGGSKHAIMCDAEGRLMAHGVLARLGDEEFIAYWLQPWIDFLAESGRYDVQGEDLTGRVFLYQIGGPKSLEILEAATGEDLRDIRFLHQRPSTITTADGRVAEVTILRLGMAGSLAYELHGKAEDSTAVYDAVVKAGEQFGIERLGFGQYILNHTENGFPQGHHDFLYPWFENPELAGHLQQMGFTGAPELRGSAGPDVSLRYRTPIDLGWTGLIRFDHDFLGREALEAEAAAPRRTMVTLVWDSEDILDVYRSYFQDGEEFRFMEFMQDPVFTASSRANFADLVLKDGETVGIATGRGYSYYYRSMISLATIDVAQSEIGTEVVVLWGDPGTRQKEIRARVERYPFYDEDRNENVDVSALPRSTAAASA